MEVEIWIPKKAKMDVVNKEYPDIYSDGDEKHGDLRYFVGRTNQEPDGRLWLTYKKPWNAAASSRVRYPARKLSSKKMAAGRKA